MNIDYNEIMALKKQIEELYPFLKQTHQNLLNLLENLDCYDDEKIDTIHSYVKEYESTISLLKSDFLKVNSENKKIESCLSQVKLLKKKRLTKLESNILRQKEVDNDFSLDDFFDFK